MAGDRREIGRLRVVCRVWCFLVLVCVRTQRVRTVYALPSVATRVVAKIYRQTPFEIS